MCTFYLLRVRIFDFSVGVQTFKLECLLCYSLGAVRRSNRPRPVQRERTSNKLYSQCNGACPEWTQEGKRLIFSPLVSNHYTLHSVSLILRLPYSRFTIAIVFVAVLNIHVLPSAVIF